MYVLALDQSTQGTKAVLLDEQGDILGREDRKHRQIVSQEGWISHDLEEIFQNVCDAVGGLLKNTCVTREEIAAVGISNQRETTAAWLEDGTPVGNAVVWQCARAKRITELMGEHARDIQMRTGIPLSPYFSAAKMAWILKNMGPARKVHLGTIDSYLVYRLTGGNFATDYSNAARTQLLNLHTLEWDDEICRWFGIPMHMLPELRDSNACFGYTDIQGLLPKAVPILGVLGDSNGALFGQGCLATGQTKVTYGTGSSVMMNTGEQFKTSAHNLAASLAWRISGTTSYVLEGNINYTGAIISWLQNDLKLIKGPDEVEILLRQANKKDTSYLVPAFSGLSAPYWEDNAKAVICGMSRTTGKAELVKAAIESIAYQVNDVLQALQEDSGHRVQEVKADGGASRNAYLMQFQSDISQTCIFPAVREELSAIGAAFMAGISAGMYSAQQLLEKSAPKIRYAPQIDREESGRMCAEWRNAVKKSI